MSMFARAGQGRCPRWPMMYTAPHPLNHLHSQNEYTDVHTVKHNTSEHSAQMISYRILEISKWSKVDVEHDGANIRCTVQVQCIGVGVAIVLLAILV